MRAHERSLAALTLPRWTSLSWAAVRMLGDLPGCTEHFFSTHLSPPLTLQVFIGCYYKSMTSIFSLSEDLSLCAPPTCFLIGDHHLIRVFSYTEGSLPCYIKRLEATWCELRYHYKQLKNTNWNLSMTVTLPFPLSVGSQIWVFSKTCKKFSICVRHFFPLVIKIKQKNDRAKAHVSRLIFNCNLSVRLRFMELQSCDKTYLL